LDISEFELNIGEFTIKKNSFTRELRDFIEGPEIKIILKKREHKLSGTKLLFTKDEEYQEIFL
jgi:hypothetical protein